MSTFHGVSGYPWEVVLQAANRVSGVKTAEAICSALVRLAMVVKNDWKPQPHEELKKWKIFKSDSRAKKLAKYDSILSSELPSISKQNVYKKEISKYVKLIKAKSKASTHATKKEEEKQDNKNNIFALPNGISKLKFKSRLKREMDEDAMDDVIYWDLVKYPDIMLHKITLALSDFVKNMDEDGSKKVVLFKKHNAIFDQLLAHVKTITKFMTMLTKGKAKSAKSAKSVKPTSKKTSKANKAKSKSVKQKSKKTSKAKTKPPKDKKKSAKVKKAAEAKKSKSKSPKVTSSKKAPPACFKWWKQCKKMTAAMA